MAAKLILFQIWNGALYALDSEGTLWRNNSFETSAGWKPIPGPTLKQHSKEDLAIMERIKFDISEKEKAP